MITADGKSAEIVLVTCDGVSKADGIDMCEHKGLWITPEHPILWQLDGQTELVWKMPKAVLKVQRVHFLEAIYNFELSSGASSVILNGVGVITLGQEIGFEPASDALYGWGWKHNPLRERYLVKTNLESCVPLLSQKPRIEV